MARPRASREMWATACSWSRKAGSMSSCTARRAPEMTASQRWGRACFGEMALLTGEPRSATVRAVGPGELLRLDRDRFVDLLRSDPKIGLALSATLSRRVRHASRSLTEVREALADVVESHLARLSPDSRRRLLQASLLAPGRAPSLDIVFGAEAERIRAQLADVGWKDGPPP